MKGKAQLFIYRIFILPKVLALRFKRKKMIRKLTPF